MKMELQRNHGMPRQVRPSTHRAVPTWLRVCTALFPIFATGSVANAVQNPGAAGVQEEADFQPAPFHLYDTQAARVKAAEATEHIAAGRWSEALAELQALIEEHRGEVLGAARPQPDDARNPSQSNVHAGAGMWAVRQLFSLPPEGKKLYRERFGPRAEDNLRRAIAASDRGALSRVARRWPLTAAAERAWWALGDLEVELGHSADGVRAWARAAAIHVGEPMRSTITRDDWLMLRSDVASLPEKASRAGALARLDLALELAESLDGSAGTRKETEASFVSGPATGIAAESLVISTPFGRSGVGTSAEGEAPSGWEHPYSIPEGPFHGITGSSRLFPKREGDTIFLNTSRSVHAIDAFDGEERWSMNAGRLGWNRYTDRELRDFEQAIDKSEHIVSLAASRGVVVAPLQIPWVYQESEQYNDLQIIEVIPERRLVALDAATGEELWNTLPPKDWNGDSGSFAERMTVVGPPTIVGARVLVPMAQLRGRIELHLGCFDLATGDVLWSAPLVTGQRTLNMFGRANVEFSAPPAVVVGDTAVVLTQLGIVAAVDIFTGETRWDTVYEQVVVAPPQYYSPGYMDNRWRNAPPVVTGNTIVAAPYDGKELFALDLDSGAMLWSYDQRRLSLDMNVEVIQQRRRRVGGLDILLGADDRRVILGGSRIASIEFVNGVRSGPPARLDWVWPANALHQMEDGLPVLDKARIYVPAGQRILAIERDTGLVVEELAGRIGVGNLLVADGMLFSANGSSLDARFQWRAMVERARSALAGPGATLDDAATLVRLLLERAETTLGRGGNVRDALVLLDEARTTIVDRAGIRTESAGSAAPETAAPETAAVGGDAIRLPGSPMAADSLRSDRFETQVLLGQAERMRGDVNAARQATRAALPLAVSDEQERRALLTLHEIERSRDVAARREVLGRLLATPHRNAEIGVRTDVTRSRWSEAAALGAVLDAIKTGVSPEAVWHDPWSGPVFAIDAQVRPRPTPGAFPVPGDLAEAQIECGLFARISEVEIARSLPAGSVAALSQELEALHRILRESPRENLFGVQSGSWARARILALRAMYPESTALEKFEADASVALTRAIDQARSASGNTTLLDAIPELYPGSSAAGRAADVRIEVALESGSAIDVAQIVVDSLPANWHPAWTTSRQAELLVQLASTLGGEGNTELKVGVVTNLARYSPGLEIEGPGGTRTTLAELRDRWTQERTAAVEASRPTAQERGFTSSAVMREQLKGDFTLVEKGQVLRRTDGAASESLGEIGYFASSLRLVALRSGDGGEPLWQRSESLTLTASNRPRRVALCGGSWLIVQRNDEVACLDAATGEELWTFRQPNRMIGRIEVGGGMVVVVTDHASSRDVADVHGIDVVKGLELWRLGEIGGSYHQSLKIETGRVVMLPQNQLRAAVHDLYTGHPVAAIATGRIQERMALAAWTDRGHLVIPHLGGAHSNDFANAIVAYNLDDGKPAWAVDLDQHGGGIHDLLGIIDMPAAEGSEERVRIAMLESVEKGRSSGGLLYSTFSLHILNERLGALDQRPLATIDSGERLVGIRHHKRMEIDSPLLVVLAEGDATRRPTIRAIDPKLGRIWEIPALRDLRMTAAGGLPAPLVGDGTMALMVSESRQSGKRSTTTETKLMFLDARSGTLLETRGFQAGGDMTSAREMAAFGSSLAISGKRTMEILE
ncbi:PQQ-binding-like beta-propeller repeat protein [Planctomycetes bacterium Poly30]